MPTCERCQAPLRTRGRFCMLLECRRQRKREYQKAYAARKKAEGVDIYAPYRATSQARRKAREVAGAPTLRQKFPDRYRDQDLRRRARKLGAMIEKFTRAEIFERDNWLCGICLMPVDPDAKWPAPESPSLDHVTPLVRGGAHSRANVQCSHLTCNVRKHDSLVP